MVKWTNVLSRIGNDKEMLNAFIHFYEKLKYVDWNKPSDILMTFNHADIVNCEPLNRVVINVGGNKYRLVCGYYFGKKIVQLFVKFVGTHKEYDKIDVCSIDMFKQ